MYTIGPADDLGGSQGAAVDFHIVDRSAYAWAMAGTRSNHQGTVVRWREIAPAGCLKGLAVEPQGSFATIPRGHEVIPPSRFWYQGTDSRLPFLIGEDKKRDLFSLVGPVHAEAVLVVLVDQGVAIAQAVQAQAGLDGEIANQVEFSAGRDDDVLFTVQGEDVAASLLDDLAAGEAGGMAVAREIGQSRPGLVEPPVADQAFFGGRKTCGTHQAEE